MSGSCWDVRGTPTADLESDLATLMAQRRRYAEDRSGPGARAHADIGEEIVEIKGELARRSES